MTGPSVAAAPDHPVRAARPLAVVTGASRGIGRAVVDELVAHGHDIVAVARDAAALAALAGTVHAAHAVTTGERPGPDATEVHAVVADLATVGGVDAAIAEVRALGRPLDVLVHSAGVAYAGPSTGGADEAFAEHSAINVGAPMRLTAGLVDLVRAAQGLIVVVSSAAALRVAGGFAAYAASKSALRAWTETLRVELAGQGVRITSIYPGQVATDMQEAIYAVRGDAYDPSVLLDARDVASVVGYVVERPAVELTDVSMRSAAGGSAARPATPPPATATS
jgi:short-subunit dehydrogenase